MAWVTRQYSKSRIDRAGQLLVAEQPDLLQLGEALHVVNNWRSCHAFPLNTFQNGLRKLARQVDDRPLIAQRIKRLSSIELKLQRFKTMTLSQMQDLGGCRAIVADTQAVLRLAELYQQSRMKHKLHTMDNYIDRPQGSGYRGVHLIYRYFSDRNKTYNGQKIEIQLRSTLQHAWATAVETVGMFTQVALKSSIGPERWLRFFALMGSVMAVREGTNLVAGTPEDKDALLTELRAIATELDVLNRLRSYGTALLEVDHSLTLDAHYFLVQLDLNLSKTSVTGFKSSDLKSANEKYLEVERSFASPSSDAVLVSVDDLAALKRAYPNYFLDTTFFAGIVAATLSQSSIRRTRRKPIGRRFKRRAASRG